MPDDRDYPCPKCATGELYDDGGMFMAHVVCDNKKCNYGDYPDTCGVVTGD